MLAHRRARTRALQRRSDEERAIDWLLDCDRDFCDLGLRLTRHCIEIP
jgi:hypothetical protein